jgi:Holliday junction resolvase RusA-like endonuclease
MLRLTIPLAPEGKKAPQGRIVRTRSGKQFISFYTTAQTRKYEATVKSHAIVAMRGKEILDGAVTLNLDAIFAVPDSWSDRKAMKALAGLIRPIVKPDWDNIGKLIGDAFNGVVWTDDSHVVDGRVRKFYGRVPCIIANVRTTEIGLLERDEEAA